MVEGLTRTTSHLAGSSHRVGKKRPPRFSCGGLPILFVADLWQIGIFAGIEKPVFGFQLWLRG
tara:strand:+ start:805 stop:993 length:189 start_codon:yes stop_codon:yes gene_type:complete